MEIFIKQKLREIGDRLEISEPERSKILLELACDMEMVYKEKLSSGIEPEKAKQNTLQNFTFTREELDSFKTVYITPWQRFKLKIGSSMNSRFYGILLAVLMTFVLFLTGSRFLSRDFFNSGNGLGMPAFVCLIIAGVSFVIKLFQLYVRRDFELSKLRENTGLLELCGIGTIITGVLILCEKLVSFSSNLALLAKPVFSTSEINEADLLIYREIANAGIELSLLEINVIIIFVIIFCMWYVINARMAKIQRASLNLMLMIRN